MQHCYSPVSGRELFDEFGQPKVARFSLPLAVEQCREAAAKARVTPVAI